MSDQQFRAFLDLLMCSDPWPVAGDDGEHCHEILTDLADDESYKRGFSTWIDAFHSFKLAR